MQKLYARIVLISIFAIAMALLESAVVIYLRELYYPEGFQFPLVPLNSRIALTEILREAATIIMLASVGILAGRTTSQRLAWFIYSFAVWDIFYYVFLWVLIGWPESLMTWDILFLIPAPWTGPVITPLILTALMIILALIILVYQEKGVETKITRLEWFGLLFGSLIVIAGFITDYLRHMFERFTISELISFNNTDLLLHAESYIPKSFPWIIFTSGALIITASIGGYYIRLRR